jgi:N-acetylmuramoyl-L-alanine amidase
LQFDSIGMSANPTRVDWEAPPAPLQEGNRVLDSIARQESLRALLAFSELHEQIRDRRVYSEIAANSDLFETERFILDEVLQLICDRAQAITNADGIVVALLDETIAENANDQGLGELGLKSIFPDVVCRATAGPLAIERGVHLIGDSKFLQECLESGRILRCDDCDTDARVESDLARQMTARSTVLVPLRGRHEQLGVIQVFSMNVRAFSDQDIRCFDLFAELILSALKPMDQNRRIHWLSDVADEVLRKKPARATIESVNAVVETEPAPPVASSPAFTTTSAALPDSAPPSLTQATVISAPTVVLTERLHEPDVYDEAPEAEAAFDTADTLLAPTLTQPRVLPFLRRVSFSGGSRPGLSVVMGLVALAAAFSAVAWWGLQVHGRTAAARTEAARGGRTDIAADSVSPQTVTAPPAPPENVLSPTLSDNLMSPTPAGLDATALIAATSGKSGALPKITGVRHWSSSMGSTVVIDMEDQVPYEVHRLMSPERIYFDLHDTVLSPELDGKSMDVGDVSLTRVRVAQPVAGITRIVLDTKDGSNFSVSMESNPYRLVVELRGTDKTLTANQFVPNRTTSKSAAASIAALPAPLKVAPEKAKALEARVSDQPLPAKTGKFRLVLDAGHGGWDLGTVGRQGLLEKNLALDVTQRLGRLLQTRLGAEVMFTRSDDTYLPLDQRADIANHTQADLFVSVHANYSSSAASRGVETYYTTLFSAPGSREVEKHDDGTFAKLTPVSLSSGGLHEKIEESRRLAASVQHSLYATLAANSPDIRNRGTKDAAFAVLTGTTMPAILTEISFVSSPADERNLQSAAYRQQIAEALYKGIARYEETAPRSRVAQLQTTAARR